MKKLFVFSILLVFFLGCMSNKKEHKNKQIPYTLAKNYFVRNDAKFASSLVLSSRSEFDSIFGMATVMGKDGEPTAIDFEKQFAIAIIDSTTNIETSIEILDLKEENSKLQLDYKLLKGDTLSYWTNPFVLLIIDNEYKKDLKLNCQ